MERRFRLRLGVVSLNSEQITALAQAEADAAVTQPAQGMRSRRQRTIGAVALALLSVFWALTGLMFWSGRWPAAEAFAALVAAPALMLVVIGALRAVRAAREALEVVDAHD
jgi:hypothetical protein